MSWRRVIPTWAAIYALVFQALTPFAQALPSPSAAKPLVICTQFGPRILSPSSVPNQDPRGAAQRMLDKLNCAVCLSLDTVRVFVPNRRAGLPAFLVAQAAAYPSEPGAGTNAFSNARVWPRAPPQSA